MRTSPAFSPMPRAVPPPDAPRADHSLEHTFRRALDGLVARLRDDRTVLATILCGSLSHDTVWAGSDIDLVLVTVDERTKDDAARSLDADGVNVHAWLVPRAEFRRIAEGTLRNSFLHSLLAKGRLVYTHDATIAALCERLQVVGERDAELFLLRAAMSALGSLYKAHKWLVTRGDVRYTALWILYTATPLAQIEVAGRHLIADREVVPQAMRLNPALFQVIYADLLDGATQERVEAALATIDAFLAERATTLFAPVLAHLRETGDARSCTELEHHFARTLGIEGITMACEYLADQRLIGKTAVSARLTRRSNVDVPERAFFAIE